MLHFSSPLFLSLSLSPATFLPSPSLPPTLPPSILPPSLHLFLPSAPPPSLPPFLSLSLLPLYLSLPDLSPPLIELISFIGLWLVNKDHALEVQARKMQYRAMSLLSPQEMMTRGAIFFANQDSKNSDGGHVTTHKVKGKEIR